MNKREKERWRKKKKNTELESISIYGRQQNSSNIAFPQIELLHSPLDCKEEKIKNME